MRFLLIACLLSIGCANSQKKNPQKIHVGGPCVGCEALYEYGKKTLKTIDTIPGFETTSQKMMVTGLIFEKDGKTPAKDVILYAYHTDEKGIYPKKNNSKGWERRHGYMRGWVKTDKTGRYTFYTLRPASYPNTTIEQHIHLTVKEPNINEYYIDDITFDDDPHLSNRTKNRQNPRGGKGIVTLERDGDFLIANRTIILGKNIPNYPK
ncbi:MAG: intradiol ring-cleavage dioxygenase [Flavobacteriaceae bacterium]|nr:intradiol ring-cleavage dioxygenase [Flavobacteriaceae bacterium]